MILIKPNSMDTKRHSLRQLWHENWFRVHRFGINYDETRWITFWMIYNVHQVSIILRNSIVPFPIQSRYKLFLLKNLLKFWINPNLHFAVGGLMNGSIKVFSAITGNLAGVLENEESLTEAMPISRIKCKPNSGGDNPILAATYVSGHLRLWNYANGQCISTVLFLL